MRIVRVELGPRSYPIYIGDGLLARPDLLLPHLAGRQVMVVTDDHVAPLYLDALGAGLTGREVHSVVLPAGEEHKTLRVVDAVFDALLGERCDRSVTLVALGGGVVGDMAGFAAACYQRGVACVQIPTTLLAQVDSSVGGKTGVNHPRGKNMIGAFHQPRAVLADTATLSTLPDRELRAGLAEVIKYGVIRDAPLFRWLEASIHRLLARDPDALAYAIEQSCLNKAAVVGSDERESGERALLNLGHTFGHAVEAGLGYGQWLHGEAVAAGMVAAADLARRLGWLASTDAERIGRLLQAAGLPVRLPATLPAERMLELMAVDKKVRDGHLRLVLPRALGQALVTDEFPAALLKKTLQECRA